MTETITSFQNPKVKQIKHLRDKKARLADGRFVIDDGRDLERALAMGYQLDYALMCPQMVKPEEATLLGHLPQNRLYTVPKDILEKVSYRENPSGMVAVMHSIPQHTARALEMVTSPLILVLVNLQKPGNIGALLRTADATGFNAIFFVDISLDLYNPNIIRSSTGACFLGNSYALTSAQALTFLKAQGYTIVSAVVDGNKPLYEVNFKRKIAVVLGTEDVGLPSIWMDSADERVRIPMLGHLSDSFNVSVSGAIFMMEALRQNHF